MCGNRQESGIRMDERNGEKEKMIGAIILAVVFIGLFTLTVAGLGIKHAIAVWLSATAIAALLAIGIFLLFGKGGQEGTRRGKIKVKKRNDEDFWLCYALGFTLSIAIVTLIRLLA